ncbi:MAG: hypothetical protein SFV23_00535 [Planctomycetaceae bacterium]|nr:hypothetical protein [Planctomycetaceae bacterium]
MPRTPLSSGLLFAFLTVGYALVHLMVGLWCGSLLEPILTKEAVSEHVQWTKSGDMIVQRSVRPAGSIQYSQVTYNTLDGVELPASEIQSQFTTPVGIGTWWSSTTPPTVDVVPWSKRIQSLHDRGTPPAFWYLIAPATDHSDFYLVGYDVNSRQKIGYLGVQGFSLQEPARDARFATRPYGDELWDRLTTSNISNLRGYPDPFEPRGQDHEDIDCDNVTGVRVWVLMGGSVYEIDPRRRTVRELLKADSALLLTKTILEGNGKRVFHLLLRSDDALTVVDPATLEQRRLALPPTGRHQAMYALEAADGRFVVTTTTYNPSDPNTGVKYEFRWFNTDGSLARSLSRELLGRQSQQLEPETQSVGLAVCLPAPILSLGVTLLAPLFMVFDGVGDYSANLAFVARWIAVWVLATLATGVACGWACRRRELEIYQSRSWMWPIVVGLLGWFGWVGYHCLRPLPAKLPDGRWMPRRPDVVPPLGCELMA